MWETELLERIVALTHVLRSRVGVRKPYKPNPFTMVQLSKLDEKPKVRGTQLIKYPGVLIMIVERLGILEEDGTLITKTPE